MVSSVSTRSIRCLAFCSVLAAVLHAGVGFAESPYEESGLVRVTVTREMKYNGDAPLLNGRLLDEYNPILIQKFSSSGVVLDDECHIMTFLGFGMIFIDRKDSRFEIAEAEGQQYKGELVGIDHGNGAAVLHVPGGNFKKTSICEGCALHEGETVIAPVSKGKEGTLFQSTQVISVDSRGVVQEKAGWVVRMNRPFLDAGQPFFTRHNQVLGFIVSQDPSGVRSVVYPISELLDSARKIIKANGDIRAGWLGVNLADIHTPSGPAVGIYNVIEDSPAKEAGLSVSDIIRRYNGQRIQDVRHLFPLIENTPVGSKVELEILRGRRTMSLTATIQAREYQNPLENMTLDLQNPFEPLRIGPAPKPPFGPPRPQIGFSTVDLTPIIADSLKLQQKKGLLVVDIVQKSPAFLAGLKNRDIILSVNERPVNNAGELSSFLQSLRPGSTVSMKVFREGSERTVSLQLPDKN